MIDGRMNLNDNWKFSENFSREMIQYNYDDSNMQVVRLPHTGRQLSYNYNNPKACEMISCYRNEFTLGKDNIGKTVLITFEGAAHEAAVYINEKQAAIHKCGYTAFTIDISSLVVFDRPNVITVKLDSRESLNQPPFGNVIDYMTYSGLYREVFIDIKNPIYIDDIYVYQEKITDKPAVHDGEETNVNPSAKSIINNNSQAESVTDIQDKAILNYELTIADKVDIRDQKGYYAALELCDKDGNVIQELDNCEISRELRFGQTESQPMQSLRNKLNGRQFSGAIDEVKRHIIKGTINSDKLEKWSIDNPKLYILKIQLKRHDFDTVYDEKSARFGIRGTQFKADGFYLNNEKVKLRGINRHQSYAYTGYAMPESMQRLDADIIKNELGMNAVRTSHYPQSKHFLDRCDELGLLVFTEIPGWQHIGDEEWKKVLCQDTEEMVLQNRNHPSVILWGVRVNESCDDDELYTMTNNIAHELDKTRFTAGVRNFKKSNLLEDVYTYNDFLYDGYSDCIEKKKNVTSDENKAYIISEYNGHMYPSKTFDCEEHRLEHALRHAKVMDAYYREDNIAGGFAWCMADYNTHQDFGSGDGICYHGVLDMFRNPKLASYVYACNGSEDVLEISSSMDIGEHQSGIPGSIYFFSNADSVKLYKNSEFIKEYPCGKNIIRKKTEYQGLAFPPVEVDDLIGDTLEKQEEMSHGKAENIKKILMAVSKYGVNHLPVDIKMRAAKLMTLYHIKFQDAYALYEKYIGNWGNKATRYRFEAIKNGNVVKTVVKEPVTATYINAVADHTQLKESTTYDVALVRIKAQDQNGNLLSYYNEPIILKSQGSIQIIGPEIIALRGGYAGTYVKTTGVQGEAALIIKDAAGNEGTISFTIEISE